MAPLAEQAARAMWRSGSPTLALVVDSALPQGQIAPRLSTPGLANNATPSLLARIQSAVRVVSMPSQCATREPASN